MSRITSITLSVVLSALVAHDASAQWNVARFGAEQSRVYTTFGLDPAVVTSVGLSRVGSLVGHDVQISGEVGVVTARIDTRDFRTDRKSTRLNSSHSQISYAVFCLKKKK